MGLMLELTEDEYTRLEAYARHRGRTPHELVAEWLLSVTTPLTAKNAFHTSG